MRLAAAQAEARPGDLTHNVATAARLVRRARARVVALPEAFLTGYDARAFAGTLPTPGDLAGGVLDPLRAAAADAGTTVVASAAVLRPHGRTLSSVVVSPGGEVDVPYDKQHLDGDEPAWFVPGAPGAVLLDVDGHSLALSICRDGSVPAHAAQAAAAGAVGYLCSAAYFPGGERRMDVTYAARALDHRFPVVVAGLTGPGFIGGSAVYGPDATPLARLGAEEGVAVAEVELGFPTREL
ncbi:carbon-nitrogen hydrolase family protein [Nocardioides convexus]|uniref:carbon-nitrogen hydrolase family protein n=1 Tax=Nocardioides convexus TaxID=2712224 RepID=UPI00241872E8|nr:carbon-nitrogen hydrolase family protein [Nocardioides convexus]